MTKRILILVLSVDGEYTPIIEAIRATWGQGPPSNITVRYYYPWRRGEQYPRPEAHHVVTYGDDTYITGYDDTMNSVMHETVAVFGRVLSDLQFDYVFRCCAGSYLVLDAMNEYLQDKPVNRFYAGAPGHWEDAGTGHNFPYASGSGYFLSRDLVELIWRSRDDILHGKDPGCNDDVAIGRCLARNGVPAVVAPRVNGDQLDSAFLADGGVRHYHYHPGKDAAAFYRLHMRLASS